MTSTEREFVKSLRRDERWKRIIGLRRVYRGYWCRAFLWFPYRTWVEANKDRPRGGPVVRIIL